MSPTAKQSRLVERANKRLQLPVPEFVLKRRELVIDLLLEQEEIVEYIESAAAGQDDKRAELFERARQYAREIGPRFSPLFYFRVGYHLARTLIRLHFHVRTVAVAEQSLANIGSDTTVVFVSNHRSNFDPLVITYLASRRSTITLSAGEWARLWPLHHLVRAAGGFVVDRDAGDPLYKRVLAAYVRLFAANGVHQAFFPEGALTQDGGMNAPKLGFLGFYCRAGSPQRDIVFVPVGINYDRIPEDRKLAGAQDSFENPRIRFLIASTLRYVWSVIALAFRRRSRRYGNACVSFGHPVFLRQWLTEHNIDISDLATPGRLRWLPSLAEDLMQQCAGEIPVTPVAAIASVLLRDRVKVSWTVAELSKHVDDLIAELEANGARIYAPGGAAAIVRDALELLLHNKLVRRDDNDSYTVIEKDVSVLGHYANSIEHLMS